MKILIWGCGNDYLKSWALIKYWEQKGIYEVVGITGNEKNIHYMDGYKFYPKNMIKDINYDYIIVSSEKYFGEIINEALTMEIPPEIIVPIRVINQPDWNFDDYMKIRKDRVTIISNSCWGGVTYHMLGMPFLSPFINMYLWEEEYLEFLEKFYYEPEIIYRDIEFEGYKMDTYVNHEHPVFKLGSLKLFMNHYKTMEEGLVKWNERRQRINLNNMLIEMATENRNTAEKFSLLPFEKKVCFVPFISDIPGTCYIPSDGRPQDHGLGWWVTDVAKGYRYAYDVLPLVKDGVISKKRLAINE